MLGIILSALPALGSLLGAGRGGDLITAGAKVAQEVFGTTKEAEITAKMEADPALAEQFKARLEAETAALTAQLADVQDARATTVRLAETGSAIAWGTLVYAGSVVASFNFVLIWLLLTPVQISDAAGAILTVLLGVLTREIASVGSYFLGSSAGSANKEAALQAIARQASAPSAGQIAGKVVDAAVKSVSKR